MVRRAVGEKGEGEMVRGGGAGRGRDYNAATVATNGKGLFPSILHPRFLAEPRFWIHFSESIIEIVVATSQSGHYHR